MANTQQLTPVPEGIKPEAQQMGLDKTEKTNYYIGQPVAQYVAEGGWLSQIRKLSDFNSARANEVKEVEEKCVNCVYGGG